jgi:steroid delta-isomerase-like uncharacterized protein
MASAQEVGTAFVGAFNDHDEGRIRALMAENIPFEAPGDVRLRGRDDATQYAMSWLRAFPDARITVQNQIVADDWIVQEFTFTGTHDETLSGPAGDIPATHRRLEGRGVQVLRAEGDEIGDVRLYFDQVQVLTQLGLMPEAAAATA